MYQVMALEQFSYNKANPLPLSQALKGKALITLSTYEKELLALVLAIKKWWAYVLGQKFVVQTNEQSLKYLLDQRVGTHAQQWWLTKLLGYDFEVHYKKDKENSVADALSHKYMGEFSALTLPLASWLSTLRFDYTTSPELIKLQDQFCKGQLDSSIYSMRDGLIFYKNRIFVPAKSPIQDILMELMHSSPLGGHSGFHKTYHRLKS